MQYDEHTILINHNKLQDEEILHVLQENLQDVAPTEIELNNIKSYTKGVLGIAFVYLSSTAAYHAILGRNLDGSPRVKIERKLKEGSEMKESWAEMIADEEIVTTELPPLINIKEFKVQAAFATLPSEEFRSNVLCCVGFPEEIERDDLWKAFSKFTPRAFCSPRNSYPRITINRKKKVAIVKFNANSNDAIFALHMCKRLHVNDHVLSFKHAYASIREE